MIENKFNVTVGSDPELFICNDIEIVSAEGLTNGSKEKPNPISDKGHAIQEDGIMFEYNIPPVTNVDDWVKEHKFCLDYLEVLATANGYKFSNVASAEINPIYLQTQQASVFGCSPDLNVYDRCVNEPPNSNTNLRCAGGHFSIGFPFVDEEEKMEIGEKIVKIFDMFVTLPALFKDNDIRRRELYGKAGSFRFTDFGVECRQLSNFWIHSEEHMRWVFDQGLKVANLVLSGKADELIENYSNYTREAIDTINLELAKELLVKIEQTEKVLN